jgi:hypothetical protein
MDKHVRRLRADDLRWADDEGGDAGNTERTRFLVRRLEAF